MSLHWKRSLGFTIVIVAAAHAQSTTEWTPGAVPIGSQIGMFAAFPVIQGQPYTAEVLQQQTVFMSDGQRLGEAHNIHRRDSGGRLLDEALPSPPVDAGAGVVFTHHGFTLVDPIKMLSTQWDDHTRTVVVSSISVRPPEVDNFEAPCPTVAGWAKVTQQELGQRVIHGVVAAGCRTTGITHGERPHTVVIESWRSPVLRITLLETDDDSDGRQSRMEVTRLDVGEPDLTKFVPPHEYKQMMVTPHASDQVLFDRAMAAWRSKRYAVANLTFQTLLNTYPNSEYAPKAKLALEDPQIAGCGQSWGNPPACNGGSANDAVH